MFSGSLRDNLDPFGTVTDDRLWQVIEQCHLKDFVSESPEGLTHECGENGQNLRLVAMDTIFGSVPAQNLVFDNSGK